MHETNKEKIGLLEKELSFLFNGAKDGELKRLHLQKALSSQMIGHPDDPAYEDRAYMSFCKENIDKIRLLANLYENPDYKPQYAHDEDVKALAYLISDDMTKEQKLKALGDAFFQANNSGYCDAMANRLAAGQEDAQTVLWEKNCKNKDAINRLYDLIKENEA